MSHFDELVSKYRTMNYGNLQSQNPSAVSSLLDDYNDRKYFTSHLDGMDNRWVRDAQGNLQFSTPGGLLESGTGTGYATYDPFVDYGDPGYAAMFQPSSSTSTSPYAYQGTTVNRGGGGEDGRARHAALRADADLRAEIERYGFQIPDQYKTELPGLLGLFDNIKGNWEREQRIRDIMNDVKASKPFGVNKYGFETSYKGADPEGDPSGGAAPTTGPSGVDADTGKFSGGTQTGGNQGNFGGASIGGGTSGPAGTAGGHGAGQAGGAMGGDNPGNTGGTSRF